VGGETVKVDEGRSVLEQFRLDGRVAIVTGGASSLGRSLAQGLAEAGATVIIASRELKRCEEVAQQLEAAGAQAIGLPLDLTDSTSIDQLVQTVTTSFGRVDILVNNAISRYPGHVDDFPESSWEASLRVDATGFFAITQRCVREMVRSRRGVIVSIASALGERSAVPDLYPDGLASLRPSFFYAKAGVINYTRFIAVAYGPKGIRANCLSPGYNLPTRDYQAVGGKPLDPELLSRRVPMGRLGHLNEYKGAAVFLASDASSFLTGHNLVVDGGYSAW
jgi:NAD(P)-dependent dehydrogenase (short-subunit alcohol dehydrogenase family)